MRAGAALAILAALPVLLAGCSDGGAGPEGTGPTPEDVDPGSTVRGAISGVVVDEAIRPIGGAVVTLTSTGANASTDDEGQFSFLDLEPGFYAMTAAAPLYLPTQVTADVVAGQATKVKVQLVPDPTPQPYHITVKHDGFMQAWGTIAQFFVESTQESGACDCRMHFQPDPSPSAFLFEAVWEESVPNPTGPSSFYWILDEVPEGDDLYETGYCTSPCYAKVNTGSYKGGEMMARLDGPDEWVEAQQPFTMFVTTWYNGDAPEGWSVVNGDA